MKRKLPRKDSSPNKKQKSLPELIIEVDEVRGTRKIYYKNAPEYTETETLGALAKKHYRESKYFTTNIFVDGLESFEKAIKTDTEIQWINGFIEKTG
jgi:hypothetical protein